MSVSRKTCNTIITLFISFKEIASIILTNSTVNNEKTLFALFTTLFIHKKIIERRII